MYRLLIACLVVILPITASTQQQAFVPFTIDELRYNQIDQAIAKLSMPRDAHIAFQQIWQEMERQAIESAKLKIK